MPIKFTMPDPNARQRQINAAGGRPLTGTGLAPNQYATSTVASMPLTKAAQFAGSGANVIFTQPMFFSPLHTPQNWQIASKRREIYQWSFISPCNITLSDGSIMNVEDLSVPTSSCIMPIDSIEVLDGRGNFASPDLFSKRYVQKKANTITTMGTAEPLQVTNDHDCIVIRKEDVKCRYHKTKNCILGKSSPTCKRNKCSDFDNKEYLISKIKARDIRKGDYFLVPFSDEIIDSIIQDEDEARFAGHLAADGSISDSYGSVRVCMADDEIEYVLPAIDTVFDKFNVSTALCNVSTIKEKRSSNRSLFNYASKLVIGSGCAKKFTKTVTLLDPILQLHVLGAYMQSDGTYNAQNDNLEITTYSPHLANQLMMMFYRCRILARVNKQPISSSSKTFSTKNEFRYILSVPSSECGKIKEYVPGKSANWQGKENNGQKRFFYKNFVVTPVVSNTSFDYKGDVYDVRVPPSYTVTMNSIAIHQCRFYYDNEPKVAAGVDFYSQFPMSGFKLECKSKKVLRYFEQAVEDLELEDWCNYISHEYFMLGECFPFLEIKCDRCGGSGFVQRTGEECNHPDGEFNRVVVMNPDYIEVQSNVLAEHPVIALMPDEELRMLVQRREPRAIYDRLPARLIELVASGMPIPLSNRSVSHIKHSASSYATYGTSMLRRLFTILAYKTKIMTANWIVAERMILPIRVVKVGEKERPASDEDLANVQSQLAAVANDPNLTIVTHHAFEYEWFGACYDEKTLVLTKERGFCNYKDIMHEEVEIMVFDPKTGKMHYEKPLEFHEYDYNGFLTNFQGNKVDINVTPNHTMLGYKRDKITAYTMQAKDLAEINECDRYVRCVADYEGHDIEEIDVCGYKVPIDVFMKYVGYYLSEGYSSFNKKRQSWHKVSISQCPVANPEYCEDIDHCMNDLGIEYSKYEYDGRATTWDILRKNITEQIGDWFGHNSFDKKIPSFIKNLPPHRLDVLIEAFNNGDASKHQYKTTNGVQIGTNSEQLANDLLEIMFKAGYAPVLSPFRKGDQHVVNCNMTKDGKGRFPRIKQEHVHVRRYMGKVYCFETSTGFFVTMRNGKIAIQGNTGKIHSINGELEAIGKEMLDGLMLNQALLNGEASGYSSAQVGVEILIRRLERWQNKLAKWVEKKIFKPIAMMQGFIDEEKTKELNRKNDDGSPKQVYQYPKLKWNDLQLRDKSNMLQLFMQLFDKQLMSGQTLLEEFEMDYDQEQNRLREENMLAMASGQLLGQGGMEGGPGGNMGPMGMGGGPGGPPGAEGGMPGMEGGMPGMPGGGMPGGDMGGGMPGGMPGGAPGGMPAAAAGPPPRISKRGKGAKPGEDEQQQPQTKIIRFTKLEQQMYKTLSSLDIPYALFGQYQVSFPGQQQPFILDFAYPQIGVGVECLHPNTLVPTIAGSKKAKDIHLSDRLIGRNGDPVKIVRKIVNHSTGKLLKIKAMGMLPIDATGNHPFLVAKPTMTRIPRNNRYGKKWTRFYETAGEPEFVKASEVKKGDFLVIPKNRRMGLTDDIIKELDLSRYRGRAHNSHMLPERVDVTEDLCWLVGLYAAEGSADFQYKNDKISGGHVTFSLNITEIEYKEKIEIILQSIFGLPSSTYLDVESNVMRVTCCCKSLALWFRDQFGHMAYHKRLPPWLFHVNFECKDAFFNAYCAGDGCIDSLKAHGIRHRHISSSVKMLSDLQALAFSMGRFACLSRSRAPDIQHVFARRNGLKQSYVTRGPWELQTKPMGYKFKQYREDDDYFYVPVKSVEEEDYNGPVFNFETHSENKKDDHTYLVGNVCTHNCDGRPWHDREDLAQRDQQRDQKLANVGWRILRFKEDAISDHMDTIRDIIQENIIEASKNLNKSKKAAEGKSEFTKFAINTLYIDGMMGGQDRIAVNEPAMKLNEYLETGLAKFAATERDRYAKEFVERKLAVRVEDITDPYVGYMGNIFSIGEPDVQFK